MRIQKVNIEYKILLTKTERDALQGFEEKFFTEILLKRNIQTKFDIDSTIKSHIHLISNVNKFESDVKIIRKKINEFVRKFSEEVLFNQK